MVHLQSITANACRRRVLIQPFSNSCCWPSVFNIVTIAAVGSITTRNLIMVQPCTYVHSLVRGRRRKEGPLVASRTSKFPDPWSTGLAPSGMLAFSRPALRRRLSFRGSRCTTFCCLTWLHGAIATLSGSLVGCLELERLSLASSRRTLHQSLACNLLRLGSSETRWASSQRRFHWPTSVGGKVVKLLLRAV
jgi:hypothetical protein